jgi:hypothetical protein
MLRRTALLAAVTAAALTGGAVTLPEHAEGAVRHDPMLLPLPAHQPDQAAERIVCHLDTDASCQLVRDILLDAPFPWHHSGYTVQVAYQADRSHPCGDRSSTGRSLSGCASRPNRQIWLYVSWVRHLEQGRRLGIDAPARSLVRTLAHEVGHTMHQACPRERSTLDRYRQVRGISPDAPRSGHHQVGGTWYASVTEDFAEAAALYLLPSEGYRSRSPLAPSPTADDLERLAGEFFRLCPAQAPDLTLTRAPAPRAAHGAQPFPLGDTRPGGATAAARSTDTRRLDALARRYAETPADTHTGSSGASGVPQRSLDAQAARLNGLARRYAETPAVR